MVRLIDGIPISPVVYITGWIISFLLLILIFKFSPKFDNNELAEYATLGAYVFVLQSIIIPIQFLFVLFTLSGVPLVIMVKGVKRGLIISSSAIILNHIFIPGSLSMLGINLANMLIAGLVAGTIPSLVYKKMGRRVRYISGLLGGMVYYVVITGVIIIEFLFSTQDLNLSKIAYLILVAIAILGLIEGFLTAIGSSYYHRQRSTTTEQTESRSDPNQDNDEVEPIFFYDE